MSRAMCSRDVGDAKIDGVIGAYFNASSDATSLTFFGPNVTG